MLNISGEKFNVNMLEDSHVAEAYNVWKKGSRILKRKRKVSGISFLASDAGFDSLDDQISEVIQFLKAKKKLIREIMKLPDIDYALLDFGIDFIVDDDAYLKIYSFPPELVNLAGSLKLEVRLTLYPPPEKQG